MLKRKIQLLTCSTTVLCACGFFFCADALAQRGKPQAQAGGMNIMSIVQRMDTNKNGYIDPNELKGQTRVFVAKSGLQLNRSHKIKAVADAVRNRGRKNKSADKKDENRKVPGFGVEEELVGVSDFSPSGEERMSTEAMNRKFGAGVIAQVNQTLNRYDKNKTGILEPAEIRRGRWSNPTSAESDTNKDGSLSRLELAYRYKNREDAAKKKTAARTSSASRSRKVVPIPNSSASATRFRNGRSSLNRPTAATSRTASSKRGFTAGSDAYKRYAEGLLKSYDDDKDQRLSKTELKDMRRPPKNADTNKDGYVDKAELIASVEKRSGVKSSPDSSGSKSSSKKNAEKLRRPENKTYNQADSIFGGKDLNNDHQLQMSEFADDWNDEAIAEFDEKDLNKDGVITEKEWKG